MQRNAADGLFTKPSVLTASLQDIRNQRLKLCQVGRFYKIGIGRPGSEIMLIVFVGAYKNQRDIAFQLFNLSGEGNPVRIRHLDIQGYNIRLAFFYLDKCLVPVAGQKHMIPLLFKFLLIEKPDMLFIVNHQYRLLCHRIAPLIVIVINLPYRSLIYYSPRNLFSRASMTLSPRSSSFSPRASRQEAAIILSKGGGLYSSFLMENGLRESGLYPSSKYPLSISLSSILVWG